MMLLPIAPIAVSIEATSACQLRCPSCPTASGATRAALGRGYLKPEQFDRFLESNPTVRHVELSNYGEMFLHPDLPAILEIGWNRGVSMTANNGVHFNRVSDDVLTALVKYDFASMTVSIDGASDSTYRVYRIGGNFDQVVNNIKRLNDLKRQYQKPCPMLHWQFIAFGHNEHEIGQARKLARELDMTFSVKLAWGDHSPVKNTDLVSRETGLGVASREAFRAERGADYLDNICLQLWHSPQINWDGKMLGCSRNFWGDFGANAFVDGYLPSVNSDRMIHARRMLLGRAPPREDIPCTTCDIYIDRAKSMRWVTPRSSSFKAECNRR